MANSNKKNVCLYKIILVFLLSVFFFPRISSAESMKPGLLTMGYLMDAISGVNQKDAQVALDIILGRVVKRKLPGFQLETIIFEDLGSAIRSFQKNEIDVMAMTSIDFLEAGDQIKIIPAFVSITGNKPENEYILLVNKDKNIRTINQLKNGSLIINKANSGRIAIMWLNTLLIDQDLGSSDRFFGTVKRVDKTSQAVLPVFFSQADACVIRRCVFETMVELNPQLKKKLIILFESPGFLFTIGGFRYGLDERVRKVVRQVSDNLEQDIEGKQILLMFQMERFAQYKPEYLVNIETLYNKYKAFKKE